MKKIFTSVILSLGVFSVGYAQANLFDPADVDADGWIWFDTQEKIDKYIGQADNENGKYDENGKIIQLVSASFGDYIDSEASADFTGAGTDGELGGEGAKKGAMKMAPASTGMATDGGGFIVKMPSCTSFNLMVSADSKMFVRMVGTTEAGVLFGDYSIVSARFASLFRPLSSAGQKVWADIHTLDNGSEPFFKLESEKTMYAYFQNFTKNNLYIHGLKVLTADESSIEEVENPAKFEFDGKTINLRENAEVSVYSLQGAVVKVAYGTSIELGDLETGIYIVKTKSANNNIYTQKVIIQ